MADQRLSELASNVEGLCCTVDDLEQLLRQVLQKLASIERKLDEIQSGVEDLE